VLHALSCRIFRLCPAETSHSASSRQSAGSALVATIRWASGVAKEVESQRKTSLKHVKAVGGKLLLIRLHFMMSIHLS